MRTQTYLTHLTVLNFWGHLAGQLSEGEGGIGQNFLKDRVGLIKLPEGASAIAHNSFVSR